ncbi:MAG: hypothetical protein U1E36_08230 [Rickettsiales bacterium]
MQITKYIATFLLSLSIALAGFPAMAAKPECPMAKMMQEQHAKQMDMQGMKDCKGCDTMAKHEPKKSGCCDDAACNAKCSAMSGGISMNLPTYKADLPAIGEQAKRLYPADATIASAHLNSQERPPKSLA